MEDDQNKSQQKHDIKNLKTKNCVILQMRSDLYVRLCGIFFNCIIFCCMGKKGRRVSMLHPPTDRSLCTKSKTNYNM